MALRIGFIGTGVMGLAMAGHLQKAGHALTIYTRTQAKAQSLLDMGAAWAQSPKTLAAQCDMVFSIVGFPHDVEEVMLGENGALHGLKKGGLLCDMTTSSPDLAERIATQAHAKGCLSVDAPVTGGDIGAKNATLSIFVGGSDEAYQKVLPALEVMGKTIIHCDEAGMGQRAKLANQVAVAGVTFSMCESLLFAKKCGLDLKKWHDTASKGAAGSAAMTNLGPRVIDGNFEPGFYIEHFVKDLTLCLEECRRMHLDLPGLKTAEHVYSLLERNGYGKKGTQLYAQGLADLI